MRYSASKWGISIRIGRKELEEAARLKAKGYEKIHLPIEATVRGYNCTYHLSVVFEDAAGEGEERILSTQRMGAQWWKTEGILLHERKEE